MVGLGVVERRRGLDFGSNRAVACRRQRLLITVLGGHGSFEPLVQVDCRSILRADIVALPHALGGIVALPKHLEQFVETHLLRVMDHEHRLGMPGQPRTDLLIGRIGGNAAGVANGGGEHPFGLPEQALRPPKTAHAKNRLAHAVRVRANERAAIDEVLAGNRHALSAARQRPLGGRQPQLELESHQPISLRWNSGII